MNIAGASNGVADEAALAKRFRFRKSGGVLRFSFWQTTLVALQ